MKSKRKMYSKYEIRDTTRGRRNFDPQSKKKVTQGLVDIIEI